MTGPSRYRRIVGENVRTHAAGDAPADLRNLVS
jgi:hypothetical protein